MARGVNKVILIGNLGNDPEVRYMPNGNAVATVSIATTEVWKDRQSGEQQERTEWHRVVFFNRLGEIAGEYLRKGSKVFVEGKIRTRKWQDKNTGADRYTTEIVADEMQMLDAKGGAPNTDFKSAPTHDAMDASFAGAEHEGGASQRSSSPAATADFDDDIPF